MDPNSVLKWYIESFNSKRSRTPKDPNKIKSVTFNKKKGITTVVFEDGNIQMSVCHKDDIFDPYVAVAIAYASKMFGSKRKFHDWVDTQYSKQSKRLDKKNEEKK